MLRLPAALFVTPALAFSGTGAVMVQAAAGCMALAFGRNRGKGIQKSFEIGKAPGAWRDREPGLVCDQAVCTAGRHSHLAPHDLRRTCARLCHDSSGVLRQTRFLLGHASVQTTERYIGSKQK